MAIHILMGLLKVILWTMATDANNTKKQEELTTKRAKYSWAGKHVTGVTRENMPPVPRAHKTCNQCQGRTKHATGVKGTQNMQLVPRAHKTCNWCQGHTKHATGAKGTQNMQLVPRAHKTCNWRQGRKMRVTHVTIGFGLFLTEIQTNLK